MVENGHIKQLNEKNVLGGESGNRNVLELLYVIYFCKIYCGKSGSIQQKASPLVFQLWLTR